MIIWGGQANAPVNTGARFNVASNTWTEVSPLNAPRPRRRHSAVWTGTEMIVWGGFDITNVFNPSFLKDGGRYNPATDTWTSLTNVPFTLGGRASPTAVWTGTEMIVWGGYTHSGGLTPTFTYFGTGARYNPATEAWNILPLGNNPTGRTAHTAVWTGDRMLVWGGYTTAGETNTGAAYDPALNTWTPLSTNAAPTKRMEHTSAWTGREMLVWGGLSGSTELNTGASYNPTSGLWLPLTSSNAPALRTLHSTAWAGGEMFILNGQRDTTEYGALTNDNKSYSPARTYYLFQKP
jgi:N-acetylneuraminic acid mutarotase